MRHDHRLTDDALVEIRILAENSEALLFQSFAPDAIEGRGVGDAGLDRLGLDVLIADNLQQDIIALRLEAEVFEPEQHTHPRRAADTGHRDFFAAQLFRAFDVGPRDEIVGVAAGKGRDDFEIVTGGDGRQGRTATAAAELDIAGGKSRDEGRRAAQINLLDLQVVLF